MKLTHAFSIIVLSLSSVAVAQQQDGTFPPQDPQRGRGEGQEGERPRQPIDPAQLVERLMQGDANGDGKLSKDELPPQLAERLMERADTNKDGSLDRAELEAAAKNGAMAGGRGGARGGAGGAPVMNLEGAMKQMNRSYRALKSSGFDAASRKSDLDNIQSLQGAIVAAKAGGANMRMSDAAKKKFGDDRVKFEVEFRTMLLETLVNSIEIEKAVLAGKGADAKGLVAKLHDMEETGHELFQPGEGDERGERGEGAPPQPGQSGQPPRGGRGRPAGNPPSGGAPGAGN